jgi:hypothetical protein
VIFSIIWWRRGLRADISRSHAHGHADQCERQIAGRHSGGSEFAIQPAALILTAIITVHIVLGVLYESFIHPVTILPTLHGPQAIEHARFRRRTADTSMDRPW